VEITGGRACAGDQLSDDPLAALLGAQGLTVDLATDTNSLSAARLTGARLVVLNNVPREPAAAGISQRHPISSCASRRGLLMAGGEIVLVGAAIFASAVDELLPVSMELKKEQANSPPRWRS